MSRRPNRLRQATASVLAAALVAGVAACGGDGMEPVVWDVIEDVTFADAFVTAADDTFSVDLAAMTQTPSGVYLQDIVVGTGDSANVVGDTLFVTYNVWTRDGVLRDDGEFNFVLGDFSTSILGWHDAMNTQQEGGLRLAVIPPGLAYGDRPPPGLYSGAALVFTLELDSLHQWGGP